MTTPHVLDDLELYALGALPTADTTRVADHLASCATCRAEAAPLSAVVGALPDTVPAREPSASLRDRILADARLDARPRSAAVASEGRSGWVAGWQGLWTAVLERRPAGVAVAALAGLVILLAVVNVGELSVLKAVQGEKDTVTSVVRTPGRSWYMSGAGTFAGSGGTLVAPQRGPAFVLFHDLKPLASDMKYALWLVSAEGRWVRGATFAPDGHTLQMVDLTMDVSSYDRCLVTLDTTTSPAQAPVVMQSRIAPAR